MNKVKSAIDIAKIRIKLRVGLSKAPTAYIQVLIDECKRIIEKRERKK